MFDLIENSLIAGFGYISKIGNWFIPSTPVLRLTQWNLDIVVGRVEHLSKTREILMCHF